MRVFLSATILAFALAAVAFTGWRIERWFNWRFAYGGMVEQRIERLEQRVTALEKTP